MLKIKQFLIGLIIILLVNPISFAQIIWAEGVLVDESFIEIENSEDLANIKDDLTENYLLTKDINLKDGEWEPIDEGEFTGTLTGNDYTIQNMPAQYLEDENLGLFTEVEDLDNIDIEIEFAAKEIENSNELINIKEDLTGDYVLTQDIDLKDTEWEAIQGEFTGTLTGDDFIIQNMPTKFLEDENLGLFAEVEELENIDVIVKFSEENNLEQEAEEELEDANDLVKTEEVIEIEEKKSNKKEKKGQEKEIQSKIAAQATDPNVKYVSTFEAFSDALKLEEVHTINLTADIESKAGASKRIDIKSKSVVINGGNGDEIHEIKQITGGNNYSMLRFFGEDITFKNVNIVLQGKNSLLTGKKNEDWQVVFDNVNTNTKTTEGSSSNGSLVHATNANVIFKNNVNYKLESKESIINGAKSVTVKTGASVDMITQGGLYKTEAEKAKLEVNGVLKVGAQIKDNKQETNLEKASLIEFRNEKSEINIDKGKLIINSDREFKAVTNNTNQIKSGLIRFFQRTLISSEGKTSGAKFEVKNGGEVNINHQQGSILYMHSDNGQINVEGKDTEVKFQVDQGSREAGDSAHDAVIHFNAANKYQLNLNGGSKMEIIKNTGAAMGMRIGTGDGHQVNVKGGSKFKIRNKGNGTVADLDGEKAKNQALFYNGTSPEFNLSTDGAEEGLKDGSEVELIADNGVAMQMINGGVINSGKGTSFIVRGKTASQGKGVIDIGSKGLTKFVLTEPKFYDFRNNRSGGGLIFTVGESATMNGNETNVSLWTSGSNLDEQPNLRIPKLNFELSTENFGKIESIENGEEIDLSGIDGVKSYSRMSGNAAALKQVKVNDLYQPTDADKKIYAQVSIDEGDYGTRDIYPEEANVKIKIKHKNIKVDGTTITELDGGIKARRLTENSFKIYGKETLINKDKGMNGFGWAEIDLPKDTYLEAGDTIEVTGVSLLNPGGDEVGSGDFPPENILASERIVVDVTPPAPIENKNFKLTNYSRSLEGTLTEPGAVVSVKVDDKDPKGEIEYGENDSFTYTFKERLKTGERVQVFLRDNAGEVLEPISEIPDKSVTNGPDKPVTNNDVGNINPEKDMTYHDKTFLKAPIIKVTEDSGDLKFDSWPENLNFTVIAKSTTAKYLVNMDAINEGLDKHLIISDNRQKKSSWKLSARMSKQLTDKDDENNKLTNALIYRGENGDKRLNDKNSTVMIHNNVGEPEVREEFKLSSDWGIDDNPYGLFIEIMPDTRKAVYEGKVEWTLSDAP